MPALIPSWRFFDSIAPSPRVEYAFLPPKGVAAPSWLEFRPRPVKLSVFDMVLRLFYNPWRNETLFLASCAERLIKDEQEYGEHSCNEIIARICQDLEGGNIAITDISGARLQFRLTFISRCDEQMEKHVLYTSEIVDVSERQLS